MATFISNVQKVNVNSAGMWMPRGTPHCDPMGTPTAKVMRRSLLRRPLPPRRGAMREDVFDGGSATLVKSHGP